MKIFDMRAITFVGAILISTANPVSAQSERGPDRRAAPDSVISLGLGVLVSPKYIGAKKTKAQPVPMVFLKKGPYYIDSLRGIGYRYEAQSGLFFGQALNWDPGRTERDSNFRPGSKRLRGMGTIKDSIVTTAEIGYSFTPWLTVRAEGEFAVTERARGNRYTIGLEGGLWSEDRNDVWYSINAHISDGKYSKAHFGVTPTQSVASGFARHTPDRGVYAYSASLNWEHHFTRHWSTLLSVNAINLVGDAGRSPIVQERFNAFALVAVNYTF